MPEITVNGKKVTIREHFPAREFWGLTDEWTKLQPTSAYDEWARAVGATITSWEFEGDPRDPEAWGDLDTWDEFSPLIGYIGEYIKGRVDRAKNLGGPPS